VEYAGSFYRTRTALLKRRPASPMFLLGWASIMCGLEHQEVPSFFALLMYHDAIKNCADTWRSLRLAGWSNCLEWRRTSTLMKRILLTGMSGTGKSTVTSELAVRGYKAVDLDCDTFSE
jgi:hypothetical protein